MAANGERPDHALVGEPTNATQLGEAIKIGRRGSLNGRLRVTGVQGHVAYPHLANNPVKGLIAVLARLYEAPLDFGSAYFSPSNFEVTSIDVGNPATNVIPAKAEAMFNIRYNDRHSAESLQTKLREDAAKFLEPSGLDFELAFEPPSHAFLTEPGQLDLAPDQGGARDHRAHAFACHRRRHVRRALHQGALPGGRVRVLTKTIHKIDEQVSISDLEQLTAVYRRFLDLYFEEFGIFELV